MTERLRALGQHLPAWERLAAAAVVVGGWVAEREEQGEQEQE